MNLTSQNPLRAKFAEPEALGYAPREPAEEDGWVVLCDPEGSGPNVSLDRVPEPFKPLGKTSRVHLDFYTSDQEGEVERLLGIGATRYPQEYAGRRLRRAGRPRRQPLLRRSVTRRELDDPPSELLRTL
ncbi:MAG: hypothetical protein M3R38_09205 [Actinomycetota bacterium]|nr:hypothetical protein [Actinomycetota bacterium]